VADGSLESRIDLGLQSSPKKKRFHVLNQKLLMFRIDRTQSVMVDQLILGCEPSLPASLADLFVNFPAERATERGFLKGRELLPATHTFDDVRHNHSF
jgi:hypothetical protein